MKIHCDRCGKDHSLDDMEPTHAFPDVVFDMSQEQRKLRCAIGNDLCVIKHVGGTRDCFVRVLLPIRVIDKGIVNWGVWVSVAEHTFDEILDLWESPKQTEAGPWIGAIANELLCYPGSLGLIGEVRFTDPEQVPRLTLTDSSDHQLVIAQVNGVSKATFYEWALIAAHGAEGRN